MTDRTKMNTIVSFDLDDPKNPKVIPPEPPPTMPMRVVTPSTSAPAPVRRKQRTFEELEKEVVQSYASLIDSMDTEAEKIKQPVDIPTTAVEFDPDHHAELTVALGVWLGSSYDLKLIDGFARKIEDFMTQRYALLPVIFRHTDIDETRK